jgi:hypothetical protein
MVYFWLKIIILASVIVISTYVVASREAFRTSTEDTHKYDVLNQNLDGNYHRTEDQIRLEEKHKLNVMYLRGDNGRPVGINVESTQNIPTFYTPGSFVHGPTAYVPSYEDAVVLPLAKTKTKM